MSKSNTLLLLKTFSLIMSSVRAVPDEKIWGSLKAKYYIFVGVVGIGCFSIQWVVVS